MRALLAILAIGCQPGGGPKADPLTPTVPVTFELEPLGPSPEATE